MMQQTARSGEKAPLFGGRKPLFTQSQLLKLTWPLLVEQFLAVTVGMADTMMVSRCGEAAISGVSLVDMINNLIIVLFSALATGGAVVVSQFLGAREQKSANKSAGQLILLSGILGLGVGVLENLREEGSAVHTDNGHHTVRKRNFSAAGKVLCLSLIHI